MTWPSGLQAPGMDTDGDPGCLDYIWVRGSAEVDEARLVFDRPAAGDPTLYPSDHFGHGCTDSPSGDPPAAPRASGRSSPQTPRTLSRRSWPRSPSLDATASSSTSRASADGVAVVIHDDSLVSASRTIDRLVRSLWAGRARAYRRADARWRARRSPAAGVPRRRAQGAGRQPDVVAESAEPGAIRRPASSSRRSTRRSGGGPRHSPRLADLAHTPDLGPRTIATANAWAAPASPSCGAALDDLGRRPRSRCGARCRRLDGPPSRARPRGSSTRRRGHVRGGPGARSTLSRPIPSGPPVSLGRSP